MEARGVNRLSALFLYPPLGKNLPRRRGDTEKSQPRKIAKTATRHTFPCTTIILADSNAYRSSMLTDLQSLPASTRLSSANKLSSTGSERLSPRATLLTKLRCTPSRRATRVYIPHTDSTKAFSFFNLAVGDSSFAVVLSWLIMSFTYFCLVRCFRCGGRFARRPFMHSSSRFCHVWCQPCCL
jgi:hypothetical protein